MLRVGVCEWVLAWCSIGLWVVLVVGPCPTFAAQSAEDAAAHIIDLNDATFQESISQGEWIVNFYAPWCGQCALLKPIWRKVSHDLHRTRYQQVSVASIDCTMNPEIADMHQIRGYPTVRFFRDGQTVGDFDGTERSLEQITAWVDRLTRYPKKTHVGTMTPPPAPPSSSSSSSSLSSSSSAPSSSSSSSSSWSSSEPPDLTDLVVLKQLFGEFMTVPYRFLVTRPLVAVFGIWLVGALNGFFIAMVFTLREGRQPTRPPPTPQPPPQLAAGGPPAR